MKVILTHDNADFDAIGAMLAAYKLNPEAIPILPARLNRNVADFLTLYQNGLPFVHQHDFRPSDIEQIILVDTQRLPNIRGLHHDRIIHIIDHHPLTVELPSDQSATIDSTGAVTTMLVEDLRISTRTLTALEASLLALGIYEDTGSLTYGTTTARDIQAAAWLVEAGAVLDTVREFLSPPLTDPQQALLELLLTTVESRDLNGHAVILATAHISEHVPEVSSVAHRLRDMLDPSALFVLVQMPANLLLVARATTDAIDVGAIARLFGGGGHTRAAAATIYDQSLTQVEHSVWQALSEHVQPDITIADLMSPDPQVVEADQPIDQAIGRLRRIGHEGYPVVDNGNLVGLLTLRDADRAVEHDLGQLKIGEVMTAGRIALHPHDSVSTLEHIMVESRWGQIPVVDNDEKIIGIVTRTDLINHWSQTHSQMTAIRQSISAEQIGKILGDEVLRLIEVIATFAQETNVPVYMVGGSVRDLLLGKPNDDLDFVVEQDAIDFANRLQSRFGGEVQSYRPFATAKWLPDEATVNKAAANLDQWLTHIDFATARNEFYAHPTALPTVYNSSIKPDLHRRDFTINTLAIQISPADSMWRILDFYGGLQDLNDGVIRVLHSLSFVDDPTRILRAVRFEQRLDFKIDHRTAELTQSSLPMLRRITGERLRHEFDLLLRESNPVEGLRMLQERGILKAIHPAFVIHESGLENLRALPRHVDSIGSTLPDGTQASSTELYWHVIAACIPAVDLPDLCQRLMFGKQMTQSLIDTARLLQESNYLRSSTTKPGHVVQELEGLSHTAISIAIHYVKDPVAENNLRCYLREWQAIQPNTTGHTLMELGLPPGPCYRVILERLRRARLDGEIQTDSEEQDLLHSLIYREHICDERS